MATGWKRDGDGRWFALDACERHPSQLLNRPNPHCSAPRTPGSAGSLKVGTDSTSTGLDRDELAKLIVAAAGDSMRSHVLVLLLGLNGLRIFEALRRIAKDAVPQKARSLHPHDLRHAFVTLSQMSDVPFDASFGTVRDQGAAREIGHDAVGVGA